MADVDLTTQWSVIVDWIDGPVRHYATGLQGALERCERRRRDGLTAHVETRQVYEGEWQPYMTDPPVVPGADQGEGATS